MPIDLALSENNDLIVAGNRDYAAVISNELIEQRIRLRLKVVRGSWLLGESLGSDLSRLLTGDYTKAQAQASALVHQALRTMNEISIVGVEVITSDDPRTMAIRVGYEIVPSTQLQVSEQLSPPFVTEVFVTARV